jgi:hypothetical protein
MCTISNCLAYPSKIHIHVTDVRVRSAISCINNKPNLNFLQHFVLLTTKIQLPAKLCSLV